MNLWNQSKVMGTNTYDPFITNNLIISITNHESWRDMHLIANFTHTAGAINSA
jgi:hypothetical protein